MATLFELQYSMLLYITFVKKDFELGGKEVPSVIPNPMDLFSAQLERLTEAHFLVLYWAACSADKEVKYNITNCFDDLKSSGITRTKQTAVAVVESMHLLCLIDIKDERNRKNIYLTNFGGQALANLASSGRFQSKKSHFLEESR